jgi:hypothetical protein
MSSAQCAAPLLEAMSTALAVADPDTLAIRFENARFREWFAPGGGGGGSA